MGNEHVPKEIHEKAAQFDHLMSLIIGKTSRKKTQYLTLCPREWSIDKCSDYFQVSQYLIRKSRDFANKKWCFILAIAKEWEITQ